MANTITHVLLEKFTNVAGSKRGYVSVEIEGGTVLPVASPGEDGELPGVANFKHQWDSATEIAAENKVPFGFVDYDLIHEVMAHRR